MIKPELFSHQNTYGAYYHYSPLLERYSRPLNLYEPRPLVWKDVPSDEGFQQYLQTQGKVLTQGQDVPDMVRTFSFDFSKAKLIWHREFKEYRFNLPKDFPAYMATGVLTQDYHTLRLSWEGQGLRPVQGALIIPGTFDVQNIKEGQMAVAMPQFAKPQGTLTLTLQTPGDVKDIWRNTNDQLGVTYEAQNDGWLTMHWPYDPKWRAIVDGKRVDIAPMHKHVMGIFLAQGEHRILFEYWPQSPLRVLIPLSLMAVAIGYGLVVGYGVRQHPL